MVPVPQGRHIGRTIEKVRVRVPQGRHIGSRMECIESESAATDGMLTKQSGALWFESRRDVMLIKY